MLGVSISHSTCMFRHSNLHLVVAHLYLSLTDWWRIWGNGWRMWVARMENWPSLGRQGGHVFLSAINDDGMISPSEQCRLASLCGTLWRWSWADLGHVMHTLQQPPQANADVSGNQCKLLIAMAVASVSSDSSTSLYLAMTSIPGSSSCD